MDTRMTPTQIATEAAEAYYKQMHEYCGAYRQDAPDLAALILAAAAKMVKGSGAVEALERNTGGLAFMAGAFGHQLRQEDKLANTAAFADARAALHSLRSITGEAQP